MLDVKLEYTLDGHCQKRLEMRKGHESLRFHYDLPAMVKDNPEATGKITTNKGFVAKDTDDRGTYACFSKF